MQLGNIKKIPENGLVMFSGAISKDAVIDKRKNELFIIEPIDQIRTFRYHCDNKFLLWPLENMLEPKEVYGLLVIGRKESAIGYINGYKFEVLNKFTSGIPSKHNQGGQSQKRFERLLEEKEKHFYRKIANTINELFLNMKNFKGIFIGGPGNSKKKFINDINLDYRLRNKILDIVDLGYGGVEGIRALIEKIKEKIASLKYIREKQVMQQFMKEISNDTGLASYGLEEIVKCLNFGVVDTLILSEKLDKYKTKSGCSNCDYNEERIIQQKLLGYSKNNTHGVLCPKCGSKSLLEIKKISIIEDLGEIAESNGTKVEICSTKTEEGVMLFHTFGGVAAILRYSLGC